MLSVLTKDIKKNNLYAQIKRINEYNEYIDVSVQLLNDQKDAIYCVIECSPIFIINSE